jgi:hypothetical protein
MSSHFATAHSIFVVAVALWSARVSAWRASSSRRYQPLSLTA